MVIKIKGVKVKMIKDVFNYLEVSIELTDKKLLQLESYYDLLVEKNQQFNLTKIVEKQQVYYKHYLDSLLFVKEINLESQVIYDIGSGAGFPGIVLKILFPSIELVIIESHKKRCDFLLQVVEKLELQKVKIINERSENIDQIYYEKADIVVSRAVAPLNILLELCSPFAKIKGLIICYKGPKLQQEMNISNLSLNKLGIKFLKLQQVDIVNLGYRQIIYYNKINHTDKKYPRNFSHIKKQPLS